MQKNGISDQIEADLGNRCNTSAHTADLQCNAPHLTTTIMDKSVDTFEQNKRFLFASLRKFKKHLN